MSEDLKSTIKSIDTSKGELIINGINGGRDFFCKKVFYEKYFSEEELIFLVSGAVLKFDSVNKDSTLYANNLELVSVVSTVKDVNIEKEIIIINRLNNQQDKDFLCNKSFYEKDLSKEALSRLKIGDRVSFKPIFKNGGYFAQNLSILNKEFDAKIENSSTVLTEKINTQGLSDNLNKELLNSLNHVIKGCDFEDLTLFVLRLLGVSELYAIPRNDAAGKPDGMFKVYNASTNTPRLEVIYDCTLNPEWNKKKEVQLKNYVSQICNEIMQIEYIYQSGSAKKNIKEKILLSSNADKQVWIITKNSSQVIYKEQVKVKENEFFVSVKEISISDLISLTYNKYLDPTYTRMDELADKLKNLGTN